MYISLWENSRGHPDNVSFMQFSTKIDGFEQKDSQGFENSYNSYEQYPLEKIFIFTIYQNYTLALNHKRSLFENRKKLLTERALSELHGGILFRTFNSYYSVHFNGGLRKRRTGFCLLRTPSPRCKQFL